jgi:hypothetical protein
VQRSAKHAVDATMRGRLERIVRWRWMPMRTEPQRTCRKPKPRCLSAHPQTLRRPSPKRPHLERTNRPKANHSCRRRKTQRMRIVSAPDEPDRRKTRRVVSEEQHQPKPMRHRRESQNYKLLFCRLTPELSRPAAGWQQRAAWRIARC